MVVEKEVEEKAEEGEKEVEEKAEEGRRRRKRTKSRRENVLA